MDYKRVHKERVCVTWMRSQLDVLSLFEYISVNECRLKKQADNGAGGFHANLSALDESPVLNPFIHYNSAPMKRSIPTQGLVYIL